jgi:hypothetical protein
MVSVTLSIASFRRRFTAVASKIIDVDADIAAKLPVSVA